MERKRIELQAARDRDLAAAKADTEAAAAKAKAEARFPMEKTSWTRKKTDV